MTGKNERVDCKIYHWSNVAILSGYERFIRARHKKSPHEEGPFKKENNFFLLVFFKPFF